MLRSEPLIYPQKVLEYNIMFQVLYCFNESFVFGFLERPIGEQYSTVLLRKNMSHIGLKANESGALYDPVQ